MIRKFKNPAIVFGGGINGLGLVRNLGRKGIDVYCVAENADEVRYSKYCKKYFIIPKVKKEEKRMFSFLSRFRKNIAQDAVIFSTSDMFSIHLSNLKESLEKHYFVPHPGPEITKKLIDKNEFYKELSKTKIPFPTTYFPDSSQDVENLVKKVTYPVIVKPSITYRFYEAFRKKGFLAYSAQDLIKYYRIASKLEIDTVIQEFVSGPEKNLFGIEGYFNSKGDPKAFFAYQRLRGWPALLGVNSLLESVAISNVASLKTTTEKYLQQLGYHGVFEAEFKRDSKDDVFKIIEINPRSWLHNTFPSKCGINIIFCSYLDAIGEEVEYVEKYKVGVKSINFNYDLQTLVEQKGIIGILDCFASLPKIIDWSLFTADDILPWAVSDYYRLYRLPKNLRKLIHEKSRNKIN